MMLLKARNACEKFMGVIFNKNTKKKGEGLVSTVLVIVVLVALVVGFKDTTFPAMENVFSKLSEGISNFVS